MATVLPTLRDEQVKTKTQTLRLPTSLSRTQTQRQEKNEFSTRNAPDSSGNDGVCP